MAESPLAQQERLHRKSTAKPPWHFRPRDEYFTSLRRGSSLYKFGRTGNPDFKFFRISVDESELQWKSDLVGHGTRAVQLANVREIVEGQTTQTFKRDLRPSLAHLSFSLIYDKRGRERTLDLVCKTEQEHELWLHGLQAFVAFQREKQRRLSQSGVAAQPLARKSVSKFLGPSALADADDGEEAQQEDSSSSEHFLCDMYVWGGREADLTTPVEGWQQTLSPVLVNDSARLDVSQVCIGSGHAIVVTKHGQVYSWGRGLGGQLGHGGSQDFAQPKLVRELWERSIVVRQVECSDSMSMAVTSCGEVYTWGDGKKSGVLGHGKMVDRHWTPHKVDFPMPSIRIVSVSAGPFHCAAVSSHGGLYTWGDGFGGRLGHGTHQSRFFPAFVDYFNDMRVESVACGVFHTAAVVSPKGESSTPAEVSPYTCPQDLLDRPAMAAAAFAAEDLPEVPKNLNWGPLKTPPRASFMCPTAQPQTLTPSQSQNFSFFPGDASDPRRLGASLTGDGLRVVFTWGANDRGCLGRGEEGQDELLPGRVEGELSGLDVKQVSCGYHLTAAVSSCGRAYQWGSTGTSFSEAAPWTRSDKPRQVRGDMDSWNVEEVRCGNHHCIARAATPIGADPSTVLFAWGRGVEGQLGNEAGQDSGMPLKIKKLKGEETVGIVAGANHCMAICRNNPAVTEEAAMKDAERLEPFLLGKDKRARKSSLTIQVPTGYTAGGPPSTNSNASNGGVKLPERSPLPSARRDSMALVLQPPTTHVQRRSVGRSSGTFSALFRAAQATHMARKAAANAAKSRQNKNEVAFLYGGGINFHHQWPPEDRGQSSEHGDTDESFDDSQEVSPTEPPPTTPVLKQKYLESLEQQVAKMSSKIESLEEQLQRRVRHEHEPMRNSFTSLTRVRTSPESLARSTMHSSDSSVGVLSSPGVELPVPAASTTTRSQTSQSLIPPTPNTAGTETNGLKPWSSPVVDGDETPQNGVKEQGDAQLAAVESASSTISQRFSFNVNISSDPVGDDEADSGPSQGAHEVEGSAESSGQVSLPGKQGRSRAASVDGELKHDKMMRKLLDENTALKDQVKELQARLEAQVRGAAVEVLPTSSRLTQQVRQRRTTGGSTGSPAKPVEWVETVHPGVHLTLGAGPGGQTEVRKVRFSSKAFSKIEAQTWWRENRQRLSERYCVAATAGAPFAGLADSTHSLDLGARASQQLTVEALMPRTVHDDADHHINAMEMSASAAPPVSPSVESLAQTPPGAAPPNRAGSPSTMAKPTAVIVD